MVAVVLACVGMVAADPPGGAAGAEDLRAFRAAEAKAGREPDAHVRLALWCEAHGLKAEQVRHLALAVLADPTHAAARGLMGLVADGPRWRPPDQVAARLKADAELAARLAEYNARRAKLADKADEHWKLALWCEQQGLKPEARAHFTAVVRLDPGRDAAWKKLGCQKHNGRWMTPAQVDAELAERLAQQKADKRWRPRLEAWRGMLRDKDKAKRAEAETALNALTDPRAAPSVWRVFARGGPKDQDRAVQLLGQLDGPIAARALATLAIFAGTPETRRHAIETLRRRDSRDFLGLLIALIRDPIKYEVRQVGEAGLGSPGVLYVEGKQFNFARIFALDESLRPERAGQLMAELDAASRVNPVVAYLAATTPTGLGPSGQAGVNATWWELGFEMALVNKARQDLASYERRASRMQQRLADQVAMLEQANASIRTFNTLAVQALDGITGKDLGEDAEAWKSWWADDQGYSYKPRAQAQSQTAKPTVVDLVYVSHSCFAAGTPVRTLDGPRPIESLRVGDRALAQDTTTGRLSFQPVVAIYHNRPAATVRVTIGDEPVVATGIHRFWKAGQGWVMARDLKPGDPIRTLAGLRTVTAVTAAAVQPVFNLEVAEGQSFFVGQAGVLVHDNSLVQPTPDPFDARPTLAGRKGE